MFLADYEGVALRMVRQDASDLVLERETADWWSSSVGLWNGRTLTRGEPTRWTTMQPLPAPGGTTIEVARQFRFELVRRTPCLEGETEERCVELTMTSEIAEEDLKQAADKLRGGGGMHAEFPENGIEARVVTDPDTLLPYRVHRSRRSSMIMMQGEEQVAGGRQQDDIDMVYAYPVAPSGACDTGQ